MKCLYCGEKITLTDPQGAVFVKRVDEGGTVGRREAWHPRCKGRRPLPTDSPFGQPAIQDDQGNIVDPGFPAPERWGALPLGENP